MACTPACQRTMDQLAHRLQFAQELWSSQNDRAARCQEELGVAKFLCLALRGHVLALIRDTSRFDLETIAILRDCAAIIRMFPSFLVPSGATGDLYSQFSDTVVSESSSPDRSDVPSAMPHYLYPQPVDDLLSPRPGMRPAAGFAGSIIGRNGEVFNAVDGPPLPISSASSAVPPIVIAHDVSGTHAAVDAPSPPNIDVPPRPRVSPPQDPLVSPLAVSQTPSVTATPAPASVLEVHPAVAAAATPAAGGAPAAAPAAKPTDKPPSRRGKAAKDVAARVPAVDFGGDLDAIMGNECDPMLNFLSGPGGRSKRFSAKDSSKGRRGKSSEPPVPAARTPKASSGWLWGLWSKSPASSTGRTAGGGAGPLADTHSAPRRAADGGSGSRKASDGSAASKKSVADVRDVVEVPEYRFRNFNATGITARPKPSTVPAQMFTRCCFPGCTKEFTGLRGVKRVRCDRCQEMFCAEHCLSKMNLSDIDPDNPSKVCDTCVNAVTGGPAPTTDRSEPTATSFLDEFVAKMRKDDSGLGTQSTSRHESPPPGPPSPSGDLRAAAVGAARPDEVSPGPGRVRGASVLGELEFDVDVE